jgi:hypothetical protein
MAPSRCPDEPTLAAFEAGDAPWPVLREVGDHVDTCPAYEDTLARLGGVAADWVVETLRGLGAASTLAPHAAGLPRIPGYELLDLLGEGGMERVYRARDLRLHRLVVVTVLTRNTARRLDRFQVEARAVARLPHPNIVQIFDVGVHEGTSYLVLELVVGGTLAERLAAGPRAPRPAAALVQTLARAVHHVHAQGIVHRDMKPANVLLAALPAGAGPATPGTTTWDASWRTGPSGPGLPPRPSRPGAGRGATAGRRP